VGTRLQGKIQIACVVTKKDENILEKEKKLF
jgi:hypothetical protein